MTWEDLGNLLSRLNETFRWIILSISACKGWNAIKMLFESKDIPFNVLISNKGEPTWQETLISFFPLYIISSQKNWISQKRLMQPDL
ncbi:hypothetical protein DRN46_05660 [Thermococci archaeon]|nr:MAG: hypothetical protein DRN46_05660 [Thermococci archaeon]